MEFYVCLTLSIRKVYIDSLNLLVQRRFPMQRYCGLKERQVPLAFSVGEFAGSLPQIFLFLQNLGIPSALSDLTLTLSSNLSVVVILHKKWFSRPRNSKGFNKRENKKSN